MNIKVSRIFFIKAKLIFHIKIGLLNVFTSLQLISETQSKFLCSVSVQIYFSKNSTSSRIDILKKWIKSLLF